MSKTGPISNAAVIKHINAQIKALRDEIVERLEGIEAKIDEYEEYLANLPQKPSKPTGPKRETPIKSKSAYPYLILESLIELGGTAHVDELMKHVENKRGPDFKRHSATARRADMARSGYIQGNTQLWEITNRGREKVTPTLRDVLNQSSKPTS